MKTEKELIEAFWNETPCGTRDLNAAAGLKSFFEQLSREREQREPFIHEFARFEQRKAITMLEIGIGAASDFIRFVRAGAIATGIDLTPKSIELATARLKLEGLTATVKQADAEALPFDNNTFDFVYSWGVIHHSPRTDVCASEIVRVLRPGGTICVMLYHRHSLVALQAYILNGLLKGRPFRSLNDIICNHIESPGTKAYRRSEARALFQSLVDVRVTPVVTAYDLRYTRKHHLPLFVRYLVPSLFGWFLVVEGRKPA